MGKHHEDVVDNKLRNLGCEAYRFTLGLDALGLALSPHEC